MNLLLLQANTHEEANTPSLTGYLFRTTSREIRLALGTARLGSLGQHRSTAFLCCVLPELGSSRPCIPSAEGIVSHRLVPEVAFSLASSHLSGATHKSKMRTCPPPSICMMVKAESEHKQTSRVQHCPVCTSPTPVCAPLPPEWGSLVALPPPAPGIWGWEYGSSPLGCWVPQNPYSSGKGRPPRPITRAESLFLPPTEMERNKPNFHSCYGKYETQLHTSLPHAGPMKGT